uniref:J domain-containing protein n=1 Tax=Aegilops tauschii subsp. strangulata TaxID=200361 RepID=A0A453F0M1_AEGTS
MAQRWHPDKIANGRVDPAIAEEAKGRFQKIHEAYQGTYSLSTYMFHIGALGAFVNV